MFMLEVIISVFVFSAWYVQIMCGDGGGTLEELDCLWKNRGGVVLIEALHGKKFYMQLLLELQVVGLESWFASGVGGFC